MARLKKILGWAFSALLALSFIALVILCLLESAPRRPRPRTLLDIWRLR